MRFLKKKHHESVTSYLAKTSQKRVVNVCLSYEFENESLKSELLPEGWDMIHDLFVVGFQGVRWGGTFSRRILWRRPSCMCLHLRIVPH